MNGELRERLIEAGARAAAASQDWLWSVLSENAQDEYRKEAAAVIDALGVSLTMNAGTDPLEDPPLFRIRAGEEQT